MFWSLCLRWFSIHPWQRSIGSFSGSSPAPPAVGLWYCGLWIQLFSAVVSAQSQWQRPTTPNYEGQPHSLVCSHTSHPFPFAMMTKKNKQIYRFLFLMIFVFPSTEAKQNWRPLGGGHPRPAQPCRGGVRHAQPVERRVFCPQWRPGGPVSGLLQRWPAPRQQTPRHGQYHAPPEPPNTEGQAHGSGFTTCSWQVLGSIPNVPKSWARGWTPWIVSMSIHVSVAFFWVWVEPQLCSSMFATCFWQDRSVSYRSISIIIDNFYDLFKIRTRIKM